MVTSEQSDNSKSDPHTADSEKKNEVSKNMQLTSASVSTPATSGQPPVTSNSSGK